MNDIKQFTIRVYALIINQHNEILVSHENFMNRHIIKFPGGGLELGESTIECLKRESVEEFGQELEVLEHFYTVDFFQQAIHRPDYQVIGIYYKAQFKEGLKMIPITTNANFDLLKPGDMWVQWIPLKELAEDFMTFPTEKKVVTLLRNKQN